MDEPLHPQVELYVLIADPQANPPPGKAVFRTRREADAVAADPWAAAGWCVPHTFRVVATVVRGRYARGQEVFAAYQTAPSQGEDPWAFLGLYASWASAAEAAGEDGLSHPLRPA